jgi:hypothetical protein
MSEEVRSSEDQSLVEEGMRVLSAHMAPAKVAKFIVALRRWDGVNYAEERERLFGHLTLDELYEQVRKFQEEQKG